MSPSCRQKVVWIRTMNMRIEGWLTKRLIGGFLVLILAAPSAKAAAAVGQESAPARQEQSAPSAGAQQEGTDSGKPTVSSAQPEATLPDAPEVAQSSSTDSSTPNGSSQTSQDQQQNGGTQPVGTAAAPAVNGTGVSGSRVSGAAIAPAKQRRVRTILISVAVVVAAGVAVGTVVALSRATPSQPR
jgi:hypothetical protein